MTPLALKVAADVIARSTRERPADAELRETLRHTRGLAPGEDREISRAVFTYYRWRRWLENERGVGARLSRALELAERFHKNPFSLPADALRAKAVPDWIRGIVSMSDEWLRSLQREPKLWLRSKRGQGRALARKLGDSHAFGKGALSDAIEYKGNKNVFDTDEYRSGEFEVQDLSSQAVGLICAPGAGETWWDACAGEGGKTLHLSDLMENKGLIWASDRAEWRLDKLRRRTARAKAFNYRVALWDGGSKLPTKTRFDGVLVDAPCSGIGTWQRNPHARWTVTPEDVRELSALQSQLLAHVAQAVKPGGRLIYSVCTLALPETIAVADRFESEVPEFKPLAVLNPLAPERPAEARLWIWPQEFGANGTFVAVWKKS